MVMRGNVNLMLARPCQCRFFFHEPFCSRRNISYICHISVHL